MTRENEVPVVVRAPKLETPFELLASVPAQNLRSVRRHRHDPAAAGLRLAERDSLTAETLERPPNLEQAAFEVDVGPAQREQLTAAHACRDRYEHERLDIVLSGALQQPSDLVEIADRCLASLEPRPVHRVGRVLRNQLLPQRVVQRLTKHFVHGRDGPCGQPAVAIDPAGLQQMRIQPLEVSRAEFR